MSKKAMRKAAVWKLLEEGFYWVDGEGWQKPVRVPSNFPWHYGANSSTEAKAEEAARSRDAIERFKAYQGTPRQGYPS